MTTPDSSQIVTFRVGDDLFAADIFAVERVLRHQPPTSIPNVPDWLEGVIDYQGRVVPVVNLRARFAMPATERTSDARILVFNTHGEWVGAIVDAVLEVTSFEPSQLAPPPPIFRGLASEYLRGIIRRGDRLLIFLDVARLLAATERLQLDVAREEHAPRG